MCIRDRSYLTPAARFFPGQRGGLRYDRDGRDLVLNHSVSLPGTSQPLLPATPGWTRLTSRKVVDPSGPYSLEGNGACYRLFAFLKVPCWTLGWNPIESTNALFEPRKREIRNAEQPQADTFANGVYAVIRGRITDLAPLPSNRFLDRREIDLDRLAVPLRGIREPGAHVRHHPRHQRVRAGEARGPLAVLHRDLDPVAPRTH